MRVVVLGSGSRGNCTYVVAGGTRLLVDAGLRKGEVEARLLAAGEDVPERLDGIVITHAHGDHHAFAPDLAKRFDCPVYLSEATRRGVPWVARARTRVISRTARFDVGEVELDPLPVPHDAPQVALVLRHEWRVVGLVTDLGHVPLDLAPHLADCDTLLLESNHDPEMLERGPYRPALKRRIAGPEGHLANADAAALLARLGAPLRTVVLVHLSETNNRPELALEPASRALSGRDTTLLAATQREPLVVP